MTAQAQEGRRQLASDADRAAGLAWRAGDLDRAAKLIKAARALDPDRGEVWAQREVAIGRAFIREWNRVAFARRDAAEAEAAQ